MQKKTYLGFKIIQAEPASNPVDKSEEGYDVWYPQPDGDFYKSWSPKAVFEEAYRNSGNMTFGIAIEAMKRGFRVRRKGWNGKGMWLSYKPPGTKEFDGVEYARQPYIFMKTAQDMLVPWLASQSDMLDEDWEVIEEDLL